MKLSTTQRIVLGFTSSTMIIVLLFTIALNVFFFTGRYKAEQKMGRSQIPPRMEQRMRQMNQDTKAKNPLSETFSKYKFLEFEDPTAQLIAETKSVWYDDIIEYEGEWYLRKSAENGIHINHITPFIERQKALFRLSYILIVISGFLSAGISYFVVKRSLRDLHSLSTFVDTLDIETLDSSISFDHLPQHDEIQHVATALTQMNSKLKKQIETIKQFMGNVAHEFKTPLMVMQANTDLSLKSKEFKHGLEKNRESITQINRLLHTLTSLVTNEIKPLQNDPINIHSLLDQCVNSISSKYDQGIKRSISGDKSIILHTDLGSLEHILLNILDNARKYSGSGESINISFDNDSIIIQDSGSGIVKDDLTRIREPFRQADSSRSKDQGFGLGLPLVKTLVDRLGRTICIKSSTDKLSHGTIVTLSRD